MEQFSLETISCILYYIFWTADLLTLCKDYYARIVDIESTKYDIEKEVDFKDYQVN